MPENKARESQASTGPASGDFVGFANAPVNEDGSHVDFREVPAYDADRDEAVKAPSSIAIPQEFVDAADDEPDADELEDEAPEDPATVLEESHAETPNASPAEGEEGQQA